MMRTRTTNSKPSRHQAGFTLIELMVSLVLGLLVVLMIGTLFVRSSDNYRQDQRITDMQASLRFALAQIATDMELAGFWTSLHDPSDIDVTDGSLAIGSDCGNAAGWVWDLSTPIAVIDNATSAAAAAAHACIDASEFVEGSDIIAIKRVLAAETAAADLENNRVYLQTNSTDGQLFRHGPSAPTANVAAPFSHWRYNPTVYFLRNYSVTKGDGIPSLCRKVLLGGSPPSFSTECVGTGIEQMQLLVGIDTDLDGEPNRYDNADTANINDAVSLRIELLGRSELAHNAYLNEKTYALGNAPTYTPNDNFYRRSASLTVQTRNPNRLRTVE
ncbi:prepilin-type N-terminal cleavage/methylation domain-containing protein [bacterium]|nr:prepilin-type N-terminal cleavage/methylation domain-containing protein [bacterium]